MKNELILSSLNLTLGVIIFITIIFFISSTYMNTNYDRRDVNRDGEINLTDLSVLSVEIQNQK